MYSALGIESGGGKALENDDVDVRWKNNGISMRITAILDKGWN